MERSRTRHAGTGTAEKVRLIAMGGLLIVVVGLFLYTSARSRSAPDIAPGEAIRPLDTANAPPAARVDPRLLREVRDTTESERVTLEREAFLHLLMESGKLVPGDLRRLDAEHIDGALYDHILEDPDGYRAQPFIAKARFLFARPESIRLDPDDPAITEGYRYWTGLAADDEGRSYSFAILDEPDDFATGQVVKLSGFFLKRHALFDNLGDELVDPTLLLVGKELVHSFLRMPPVETIDHDFLDTVRDYEVEDQLTIRDDVLYHVVSYVTDVDAKVIGTDGVDRTQAQLLNAPTENRGNPVRVLGTFHDAWPRQLGPGGENPLEIDEVWHGLLVHFGPSFTYTISLEPPPDWVREEGTHVIAEGIFIKSYAYQARNRQVVNCPLLVVKRYIPYRVDTSSVNNLLAISVSVLGGLLLLWVTVSALGDRKASRDFQKRFYARKKARMAQVARDLAAGGASAPGESDPTGD